MHPKHAKNPLRKQTQSGTLMPGPSMKTALRAPLQTRKTGVPKSMGKSMPHRSQSPPNRSK